MGKSRRSRVGSARRAADPVGGRPRAVKVPSDPELAALRESKILPVIKDLRSAEPKTRTAAASAIANIVEDAKCRKLLLREQIVHTVLTETLSDSVVESRAAGWDVLNVLAQHEESDFCVHLYRCDILTPAAHALTQTIGTLKLSDPPFDKLPKAAKEYVWRIASSVIDLIGQLADARDEIAQAIAGQADITAALFSLVSHAAPPLAIKWTVLTSLAHLCEDQRPLAEAAVTEPVNGGFYAALLALKDGGGPLAVAACSLLHVLFAALEWFDHSPGRDGASDAVLVPVLASAVEQAQPLLHGFLAAAGASNGGDSRPAPQPEPAEVLGLALQTLGMMGTDLKMSLEKGNRHDEVWNGIQDDDDDDDDDDDSDKGADDAEAGEDDAEMPDGAAEGIAANGHGETMDVDTQGAGGDDADDDSVGLDEDMENVTGADDGPQTQVMGLDDVPSLRELVNSAIPPVVRIASAVFHGRGAQSQEDVDGVALAIRLDALAALNNIAWTVSCIDLSDDGNAGILQAWLPVARRIWLDVVRPFLAPDTAAIDMREASKVAGLAWALARVLGSQTPVDAGDQDKFMALCELSLAENGAGTAGADAEGAEDAEADPLQSLAVKCIGVLGQMARDPAPAAVNRKSGRFLLEKADAPAGASAVVVAAAVEALNQLFDLYGDESAACDRLVFWADGYLPAVATLVPRTKAMAKSIDKRAMAELRMRADEVVLNLGRFVQYKKKHAP